MKAVDVEYIGNYMDQKAYSYWLSGFVDTVYHASCNDNLLFLKAYVSRSQRLGDDPHHVWVCTEGPKDKSKILTSWCSCIAGTSEVCNRVIALLPPQGFRPEAKSRGGTLVARAYIKDSTYSTNMQSVYRKNLDLLEQGPRGISR